MARKRVLFRACSPGFPSATGPVPEGKVQENRSKHRTDPIWLNGEVQKEAVYEGCYHHGKRLRLAEAGRGS